MRRDSDRRLCRGYVVRDGNYLSARWPGDAHRFGDALVAMMGEVAVANR
jgi:protease I